MFRHASKVKVKLPLQMTEEAHRVVRRRGSHIFYTLDSQMAVRLSALIAGRDLRPRNFPDTVFC
jgi:hypothetical protein